VVLRGSTGTIYKNSCTRNITHNIKIEALRMRCTTGSRGEYQEKGNL
jgi:hypothetical protein